MKFIGKLLRLKVSELDLVKNFENSSYTILAQIESKMPFYTVLFPNEDLPAKALNALKSAFEEVGKIESRQVQSRKLLGKYFESKQEEICFNFFSNDCPDLILVAYAASMADSGDEFLSALLFKTNENKEDHEQFAETAKAYFKKRLYFEVYKNGVLLSVIKNLFGNLDDQEDTRRFELIVKEHVKKLGVELMLNYSSKDDQVFSPVSHGYDFTETKKRRDLISRFIQGIELNSEEVVDRVCEDFPKLLSKNYEAFKAVTSDAGLK